MAIVVCNFAVCLVRAASAADSNCKRAPALYAQRTFPAARSSARAKVPLMDVTTSSRPLPSRLARWIPFGCLWSTKYLEKHGERV